MFPTLPARALLALLVCTCAAATPAQAQRMSLAPAAFLEDVQTVASASRLGSVLLAADTTKKGWGDYCTESQELARRGEFRRAIRVATKALYLGETAHGNRGAPIIYAMNDIANAYNYAGDFASAETWADRTLQAIDKGYDSGVHQEVTRIRANAHRIRASARSQRGDHAAALAEIKKGQEVLPAFNAGYAATELALVHAMIQLRAGQAEPALQAAQKLAADKDALVRLGANRVAGEAALARNDTKAALAHFDAALAAATERKDPYQALQAQAGRARALRKAGDTAAAGQQIQASLAELEKQRRAFHSFEMRTALYGNVQSVFDEAVEFFLQQGDAAQALAASEASRARAMLDLQGKVEGPTRAPVAQPRSVAQIQQSLGEAQRMVVYHQLPTRLVAWTLGRNQLTMHDLPVPAADLHAKIETWRRAIERNEDTALAQAQVLHRQLLAPLPSVVPAQAGTQGREAATSTVFVPHRSLHLLPFQALHDGTAWLIERHAISSALSASLFDQATWSSEGATLTALGNPDLGKPEWALPDAEKEVQALPALYPKAQVFVRAEASKGALATKAPGAQIVHVAAHAVVDEIDPMYSVIKLATLGGPSVPTAAATDMQARELAGLDLSQAQLVLLSACNSGVGTVAQGDEFMGFKRALFAAGAKSALVSLWLVDDRATEALMTQFHKAWRGGSRAQALRDAQLAVLKQPRHGHPFYWAPFVLVGNPG